MRRQPPGIRVYGIMVYDIVSGDGIMALEGWFGNLQATPPSPSHPIPSH